MQPAQERRHLGAEREKYPALRLYAKMGRWSSVLVLVMGVVFGGSMIWLASQQLMLAALSNGLLMMATGAFYFIVARGTAEMLYLLLDVARNTRASRDALEKETG